MCVSGSLTWGESGYSGSNPCKKCDGEAPDSCAECYEGYYLEDGICLVDASASETDICDPEISGKSYDDLVDMGCMCVSGSLTWGESGYSGSNPCKKCDGEAPDSCAECYEGYYLEDGICLVDASASETESGCNDGYEIVLEAGKSFGAATEVTIESAKTEEKCKEACTNNADCWGFSFDNTYINCYNFLSSTLGGDRASVVNGFTTDYAANSATYAKCTPAAVTSSPTMVPTKVPTAEPSASSHGDPIIWTFKGECYDLSLDGFYLASSHPTYKHKVFVGVYNEFIREIQITDEMDTLLFAISNLDELSGQWNYGLKEWTRICTRMSWKECEWNFRQYAFDAQIFRYTVQIMFHDYLDAALKEGERGIHLDIYPKVYEKRLLEFHPSEYTGIYFDNPHPDQLHFCPVDSPRRS